MTPEAPVRGKSSRRIRGAPRPCHPPSVPRSARMALGGRGVSRAGSTRSYGETMSDAEKPQTPPTPAEQGPGKADRIQLMRDKAAVRVTPNAGRVPSLQKEQSYGFGKKVDAFDADLEQQLEEAMGGFSDKDLFAE